jgi:CubicO group peptidase (beta-lactamase class C family)
MAHVDAENTGTIAAIERRIRSVLSLLLIAACAASCSSPRLGGPREAVKGPDRAAPASASSVMPRAKVAPPLPAEHLDADTPRTTAEGTAFVAPKAWKLLVRGPATILEAPEVGSQIALVDVSTKDADTAVAAAWAAYGRPKRALKLVSDRANREGWRKTRFYFYETSPNERREVIAIARQSSSDVWTVVIEDFTIEVREKRLAQVELVQSTLLPKGYERESFAGRKARKLGAEQLAELGKFITQAQRELRIPGISVGVVQDGKVVFAGGFGVREVGKPATVDEKTLYIVGSNSKALTTLMLAKLVDERKFSWETPVTAVYSGFKLGSAETTAAVQVKHLVCACTGMPRQNYEVLEYRRETPEDKIKGLAKVEPTSKFGEMFQYSNHLAAAAGYIGGHVAYPELELGRAYDKAMQTRVFGPLGMSSSTLEFSQATRRPNHASAHAPGRDGNPSLVVSGVNEGVVVMRPAGGVWSNVTDMLKYVAMELANGKLPDGKPYIAQETLLARRLPQASVSRGVTYGMGLNIEDRYGITSVYHGGDNVGYHSQMVWLPEHGTGGVILTNGIPGWYFAYAFRRKMLELLFDGRPEADAWISTIAKAFFEDLEKKRKLVSVPAVGGDVAKLASRYANDELGEISIRRAGAATIFDFGEWTSEVASRKNPDGSVSFPLIAPGVENFEIEFVAGDGGKRTLTLHDNQQKFTFTEK